MRPSRKSEERNWSSNAPFFTDIMDGADHLLIESKQVECRYVSDQELAANCGPFLSDWNKQIYFILFYFFKKKNNFSVAGSLTRLLAESKVFLAWEPVINEMQKARRTVQDFCVFNFLNVSTCPDFFSDFFTFGRNLIRDIRTRSAHHPHLHQPPNWHLVVDRRPKKVEFWWLSLHQGCHSGTSNQAA